MSMPRPKVSCLFLAGLALMALTSCQLVGGLPQPSGQTSAGTFAQEAIPLRGTILTPARSAQAALTDVANGATLSLLDTVTGNTVATTLSDVSGRFYLSVPSASLVANRLYLLEASKGLAVGGSPNRAGSSVARLRTILSYQGGNWVSLSNASAGGAITVGTGTTALALISALRGVSAATLIGSLTPDTQRYTPIGGLTSVEYATVLGLLDAALASDRDPVESIGYDAAGAGPSTQYGLKPGDLLLYDTYAPNPVATGSTMTLNGQNLPDPRQDVQITVGDVPVAWTVSADRSKLSIVIPPDGHCGWLTITQGTSSWRGPFVWVSGTTGIWIGRGVQADLEGTGPDVALNYPCQIAFDAADNLYVADAYNHKIRRITPAGVMTTVAGSGTAGYLDGPAATAQFKTPVGMAVGPDGSLYVGDSFNHCIRKISPAGVVSTLAGSLPAGTADGTGAAAKFGEPYNVTVDQAGNVYVADHGNSLIRKITPTGVVTTLAGSTHGYLDGTGAGAKFMHAHGVAVDGTGNVYVADGGNAAIRKVTPAGVVTTVAGGVAVGEVDGATSSARLTDNTSVVMERSGNLLVADRAAGTIRRVNPTTGVVTTIIGTPGKLGSQDGAARSATLNGVFDVATDTKGRIYMAEEWGQRIRVYCP